MGLCFNAAYEITGNYGVSVVLLSVVVNIFLLPLYYLAEQWKLQEKSIKKQMEWELSSIRKYSKRRERYFYTREVYRRFGYNPISAVKVSFGFLIQIPFFFSAYLLLSHFPGWEGTGFLGLHDLSKPDGLVQGSGISVNLLPIVMTVINLASAYVYTARMDLSEKIQLWFLAFIFLAVLYNSPAGLLLYWTVNNVFSLLKNMVGQRLNFRFLNFQAGLRETGKIYGSSTIIRRLGQYRDTVIQLIDLPTRYNIVLFLAAIFSLSVRAGIADKTDPVATMAFGVSIVILGYICFVPFLQTFRKAERSLQQKLYKMMYRLLFAAFVVLTASWLSDASPLGQLLFIRKYILIILLSLVVLCFLPRFLDRAHILGRMPNRHLLYATATALTIFFVCVANPLNFYTSSLDFSGEVYDVASKLLVYFIVVLLVAIGSYILVDEKSRKGLTLVSVFSAVSVIIYSTGLNVGLLDHFILNNAFLLTRSTHEVLLEISILTVLFSVTAYATIYYRRLVVYVTGTILATSVIVTAVATYGASGDAGAENAGARQFELPDDNSEVIGFSRERNVLIILLDGFSGGYMEKIQNEAPDTLKEYEGFVWYPNTLTTNSGTWGAIAALVGGHKYVVKEINSRNEPSLAHVIEEAYAVYSDAFIPSGYEVTYVNSVPLRYLQWN